MLPKIKRDSFCRSRCLAGGVYARRPRLTFVADRLLQLAYLAADFLVARGCLRGSPGGDLQAVCQKIIFRLAPHADFSFPIPRPPVRSCPDDGIIFSAFPG
jgi:hypothetical protein